MSRVYMFCKLQRFYRFANIYEWFSIPQGILNEMIRMMPVIEAEENLNNTVINALGAGNYKKQTSNKIIEGWKRTLDIVQPKQKKPTSQAAHNATMRSLDHVVITSPDIYLDD